MKYDVVIVGAGPAGIFTALELVKNGTQYAYLKYGTTTIANLKLLDS